MEMVFLLGRLGVQRHQQVKMYLELIIMPAAAVVAVVTAQTQLVDMAAVQPVAEQVWELKHQMQLQTQAAAVVVGQFIQVKAVPELS